MPKDPGVRAFLINFAGYLAVIALLAALNVWRTPDNLWFIWVALGWGIGVAAHGLALLWRGRTARSASSAIPRRAASPFISSPTWR